MAISSQPSAATPTARCVHLYFTKGSVIVAATHRNLGGIYYEQAPAVLMNGLPTAEALGSAFRNAFDAFSVKDVNLRDAKHDDWPAFQASQLPSVREFERRYRSMDCCGLNPSNAVVRASIAHPVHADIELSVNFNPLSASDVIGALLIELARVANAT